LPPGAASIPPICPRRLFVFRCDHLNDTDTSAVFERIAAEAGSLDILVNSAWGGYEHMVEDGPFTWSRQSWQQPTHRWTSMDAGVRAAWVASSYAARKMMAARSGLIVNISSWLAQKYIGNLIYGVSNAATDKMTFDMAHEPSPLVWRWSHSTLVWCARTHAGCARGLVRSIP
jgi:NAD(P)-dependent dehydrogenase (short-subunit alcohol dehydrogenase family)